MTGRTTITPGLRIKPALWEAFCRLARGQGKTPNGALVELVEKSVGEEK